LVNIKLFFDLLSTKGASQNAKGAKGAAPAAGGAKRKGRRDRKGGSG
jgi:hypothetical protein